MPINKKGQVSNKAKIVGLIIGLCVYAIALSRDEITTQLLGILIIFVSLIALFIE